MTPTFPCRRARALTSLGAVVAALAACHPSAAPSRGDLAAALHTYLAERGQLCVAKTHWPIDLSQREIDSGARNALQMPVLERLGLVSSSVADVEVGDEEGTLHRMKVRRYALTDAGHAYYLPRPGRSTGDAAAMDFCPARLSLDRIVGWSASPGAGDARRVVVTYTYRVDAAPWTRDPEVAMVFPVVAGVVRGAGTAQLQEAFVLTPRGWVAVDARDT